jgi:hypothetical protein
MPVLGLVGVVPMWMAIASTIAMGVGLAVWGGTVTAEHRKMARWTGMADEVELTGGMTAELVGGLAVATLGVLALLEVDPLSTLGVATIVLGVSLLIGAGQTNGLNDTIGVPRVFLSVTAVAQALIGLGAITLGVLVAWRTPYISLHTVLLVALLAAGASLFASGVAAAVRVGDTLKLA